MKRENNILKWFNNELSDQEILDLKQSENLDIMEKIAHYSSQMKAPELDAAKALEIFKQKHIPKKETKVKTLNFKTFYRVAAVVAILLTSSYFVFFNNEKSFETRISETETLTLPDNSEVILNAASSLSFNKKVWKKKRELQLDGEAFFKVRKGQKFLVNTDVGTVQVLGTQFNVKERDNYFEVQCYEGIVAVSYNNDTVRLTLGKSFRVIDGKIQTVADFNAPNPSWMQQETSFENIPVYQVIAELQRQYDLNIVIEGIDATQLFTGTFTHNDMNVALQSITIPLKLSYKIDGKKVIFYRYEGQ